MYPGRAASGRDWAPGGTVGQGGAMSLHHLASLSFHLIRAPFALRTD